MLFSMSVIVDREFCHSLNSTQPCCRSVIAVIAVIAAYSRNQKSMEGGTGQHSKEQVQ